jgi:hypothetical protein
VYNVKERYVWLFVLGLQRGKAPEEAHINSELYKYAAKNFCTKITKI